MSPFGTSVARSHQSWPCHWGPTALGILPSSGWLHRGSISCCGLPSCIGPSWPLPFGHSLSLSFSPINPFFVVQVRCQLILLVGSHDSPSQLGPVRYLYVLLPYFDGLYTFFKKLAGLLQNSFVVFFDGVQFSKLLSCSIGVLLDGGVECVLGLISFPFEVVGSLVTLLHHFLLKAFLPSRDLTLLLGHLVGTILL